LELEPRGVGALLDAGLAGQMLGLQADGVFERDGCDFVLGTVHQRDGCRGEVTGPTQPAPHSSQRDDPSARGVFGDEARLAAQTTTGCEELNPSPAAAGFFCCLRGQGA